MTTITRVVTLCDMPHDVTNEAPEAMPVTITTPAQEWTVDLCPDHATHFLAPVVSSARPVKRKRRPRTTAPAG